MNKLKYEAHIKFLLIILYTYLAFRFVPTFVVWLMPFILAYFVASSTRPLAKFMTQKWKISPKISAAISLAINLVFLLGIIIAIIARIVVEIIRLASNSAYIVNGITTMASNITAYLETLEYSIDINSIVDGLTATLVTAFQWVVTRITSFAISLPQAFVFFFVFLLASIFLSLDFENIRDAVMLQLPKKYRARVRELKQHTISATLRYIRGVAILLLIDFVVLLTGFLILRVNYAFKPSLSSL